MLLSFIHKQNIKQDKILNININISGRVNPESGYSYSIFYFEERPLSEIISSKIGYRVTIDNDTRSMTYGEYLAGCVNNEKNIIFVNVSWGLAIGIIIDGKIYSGKSGFSGEFGHIQAFDNEILCHCVVLLHIKAFIPQEMPLYTRTGCGRGPPLSQTWIYYHTAASKASIIFEKPAKTPAFSAVNLTITACRHARTRQNLCRGYRLPKTS